MRVVTKHKAPWFDRVLHRAFFSRAAIAAQLVIVQAVTFGSLHVYAAVPIEESVEDYRRDEQLPATRVRTVERTVQRASDRARSLDIPPTIEPVANSDYNAPRADYAGSNEPVRPISQTPTAGAATRPISVQPLQAAGASNSQLSQLFYQLQVLQQEIQDLRGQVEEQTYLVKRLQRDQKEQYLDLDRRVVAVTTNQPAPGPSSTPTEQVRSQPGGTNLTERQVYTQAFEAMKARQFDESMVGFQNLIVKFPNGQYTPNAYYWMGELHLVAKTNPELARQSFMQVVSLYPDHQKAPDALYKLGVVYHNLGDVPSAKKFLQRVQNEHPDSAAAGLAAKYAAEL